MEKNLEIAKNIHKYKVLWEMSNKDPNQLIAQAANDIVNSQSNNNNIDKEYMKQIILMYYQILLNMSEIYKKEMDK